MAIKPGKATLGAKLLQRYLNKHNIVFGFRSGYVAMGEFGVWASCLSKTTNLRDAIKTWNMVYPKGRRGR